jgi:alkylation response protein AidB-like acyl-CoA dehydrogenase
MTTLTMNGVAVDVVDTARQLADEFRARATDLDRSAEFPAANYKRMRELGYLRAPVPKELGGLGCGLFDIARAQTQLARGCGSTALAVNMHLFQVGFASDAWRKGGAPPSVEGMLRRVAQEGIVLGSTGAEAIVAGDWSASTLAQRTEDGYRVNGRKYFVSQAPGMDLVRITATDVDTGELLLMMLPAHAPGVSIVETWDTTGMRATASHDLLLEDVLIPETAISVRAPAGAPMRLPAMAGVGVWFSMLIASVYLGVAEEAHAEALRSIGSGINSSHRHPVLTDVLVGQLEGELLIAQSVRDQVAAQLDADRSNLQRSLGQAILCRQVVTSHAMSVVDKAVEIAGGRAYFRTSTLERLARDVRAARFHPPAAPTSFQMVGERVRAEL